MPAPRRFLVPEIIQTSGMDCGPAALSCLLSGMGLPVSYGRLREACQTDVDGTSIDTLEEIAVQLGLEAEQVMVPLDHLLLPSADNLPAIVVVVLPNKFTHFVVVWRPHGRFLQVMDPATGRRWPTVAQFLSTVYEHSLAVPAEGWQEWASSDDFLDPLRARLKQVGVGTTEAQALIAPAVATGTWEPLAQLDAAVRLCAALVQTEAIRAGREAYATIQTLVRQAQQAEDSTTIIPANYWSVRPTAAQEEGEEAEEPQLALRGAVLIRAKKLQPPAERPPLADLSPEMVAALQEKPLSPLRQLWHMLRHEAPQQMALVGLTALFTSLGVVIEWLLLTGLINVGETLQLAPERWGAMAAVLFFMGLILLLQRHMLKASLRLGRYVENYCRIALLEKIPRLRPQYFLSRPNSDMAQRSHSVHRLRGLPLLGISIWQACLTIVWTVIALVWLNPSGAGWVALAAVASVGLPFLLQPLVIEQDMRLRTYTGALSRFFLDGLLGIVPLRTHHAENTMRHEHEALLGQWATAALRFHKLTITTQGVQRGVGYVTAVLIVFSYLTHQAHSLSLLLVAYWSLTLTQLGEEIAQSVRQYPALRNTAMRLLEPLGAPEEEGLDEPSETAESPLAGMEIAFEGVSVVASSHEVLADIQVRLRPGEHVALVGASGAGKSTFLGLLLGWQRPAHGRILINGRPLAAQQAWLRQHTAWVDPAIQLWNDSLLANLQYGNGAEVVGQLPHVLSQAELLSVLRHLPDGLQTPLGEGGGLLSGGEGQRVRFGRALLRPEVRLVLLDEPFRGLARSQRQTLLGRARHVWAEATLLCVTHDVQETTHFDRVLVMDNGRIIEDDAPATLLANPESAYARLLQAETAVQQTLWQDPHWQRWYLAEGQLTITPAPALPTEEQLA